ncbi:MAG: lactoylglutathione lyase [Lactobacillaceae bacterium]|jgi:hypothetical protein|nr:lactoylglutathione lyase [Lactobacillaceae bacterium]
MKPRKMMPKIVPSKDPKRALRFYRDFFSFLQDTDQNGNRILIIDNGVIQFVKNDTPSNKIEILARDHFEDIKKHLQNFFIDFRIEDDLKNASKIYFVFKDTEDNLIYLQVNR